MYYFREDLKSKKTVNINVLDKKIKMGLNESTLDPFEVVKEEFLEKMKNVQINRYFNSITKTLGKQLADYAEVAPECLAFGNGADEMLYYLFNSVRSDNNSFAVSLAPTYFDYKSYSGAVGLGIKFLSLNTDFDFSVEHTAWGTFHGKAGSFLVKSYEDKDTQFPEDIWIVKREIFEATYERV